MAHELIELIRALLSNHPGTIVQRDADARLSAFQNHRSAWNTCYEALGRSGIGLHSTQTAFITATIMQNVLQSHEPSTLEGCISGGLGMGGACGHILTLIECSIATGDTALPHLQDVLVLNRLCLILASAMVLTPVPKLQQCFNAMWVFACECPSPSTVSYTPSSPSRWIVLLRMLELLSQQVESTRMQLNVFERGAVCDMLSQMRPRVIHVLQVAIRNSAIEVQKQSLQTLSAWLLCSASQSSGDRRLGISLIDLYRQPLFGLLAEAARSCRVTGEVPKASSVIAMEAINTLTQLYSFPSPEQQWLSQRGNEKYCDDLYHALQLSVTVLVQIATEYWDWFGTAEGVDVARSYTTLVVTFLESHGHLVIFGKLHAMQIPSAVGGLASLVPLDGDAKLSAGNIMLCILVQLTRQSDVSLAVLCLDYWFTFFDRVRTIEATLSESGPLMYDWILDPLLESFLHQCSLPSIESSHTGSKMEDLNEHSLEFRKLCGDLMLTMASPLHWPGQRYTLEFLSRAFVAHYHCDTSHPPTAAVTSPGTKSGSSSPRSTIIAATLASHGTHWHILEVILFLLKFVAEASSMLDYLEDKDEDETDGESGDDGSDSDRDGGSSTGAVAGNKEISTEEFAVEQAWIGIITSFPSLIENIRTAHSACVLICDIAGWVTKRKTELLEPCVLLLLQGLRQSESLSLAVQASKALKIISTVAITRIVDSSGVAGIGPGTMIQTVVQLFDDSSLIFHSSGEARANVLHAATEIASHLPKPEDSAVVLQHIVTPIVHNLALATSFEEVHSALGRLRSISKALKPPAMALSLLSAAWETINHISSIIYNNAHSPVEVMDQLCCLYKDISISVGTEIPPFLHELTSNMVILYCKKDHTGALDTLRVFLEKWGSIPHLSHYWNEVLLTLSRKTQILFSPNSNAVPDVVMAYFRLMTTVNRERLILEASQYRESLEKIISDQTIPAESALVLSLQLACYCFTPPLQHRDALRAVLHFFRTLWANSEIDDGGLLLFQAFGQQLIISELSGIAGAIPKECGKWLFENLYVLLCDATVSSDVRATAAMATQVALIPATGAHSLVAGHLQTITRHRIVTSLLSIGVGGNRMHFKRILNDFLLLARGMMREEDLALGECAPGMASAVGDESGDIDVTMC